MLPRSMPAALAGRLVLLVLLARSAVRLATRVWRRRLRIRLPALPARLGRPRARKASPVLRVRKVSQVALVRTDKLARQVRKAQLE